VGLARHMIALRKGPAGGVMVRKGAFSYYSCAQVWMYRALALLVLSAVVGSSPLVAASIDIGAIIFLTGNQSFLGQEVRNGMLMAIDELKTSGAPLNVILADSKDTPSEAVTAFNRLTTANAAPLIISTGDVVSLSLIPLADRRQTVLVATVAATPDLPSRGNMVFRNWPSSARQAEVAAKFTTISLGLKDVAALHINNEYGLTWLDALKSYLGTQGVTLKDVQTFDIAAQDVRPQLSAMLAKKPKAVYLGGFGPGYGVAITQLRELSPETFIITDATFSIPFVQQQIGAAGERVIFASTIFDAEFPANKKIGDFVAQYERRFGQKPSFTAAFGYDTLMLVAAAAKVLPEAPQTSREQKAASLKEALLKIGNYDGVMGTLSVGNDRNVSFPILIKTIINRRPVKLED
jgi:branched-chain amino acid transport system substrate-binding protein